MAIPAITSDIIEAAEPQIFQANTTVVKNIIGFGRTRFLSRIRPDSFDFGEILSLTDTALGSGGSAGDKISIGSVLAAAEADPRTFIMREFVDVTYPSPATIAEFDIIIDEFLELDLPTGGSASPTRVQVGTFLLRESAPSSPEPSFSLNDFTDYVEFSFSLGTPSKKNRLIELYGEGTRVPFTLPMPPEEPEEREALDIEAQSAMSNDTISYSSLSSLGETAIEQLNISAEGGTLTVTTIEEVEVVEDVGGVTSFARGVDRGETTAARGTRTIGDGTADVRRSY
jgi:hypothetical protein